MSPRMGRRSSMKTFSGEHGRLEDLFRFEDRLSSMPEEAGRNWRWWAVGVTVLLTVVVDFIAHFAGYAPPLLLILAVCAGAVAVRLLLLTVPEPTWRRVGDLVHHPVEGSLITPGGWTGNTDGMLDAIRRWDRRLEWGATSPQRYAYTVAPRLGELADQWLREQHGLTRASDPAKARALLGEPMWATLHPAAGTAPTARQLARVLAGLARPDRTDAASPDTASH
jgi:hypothetical protein